MKTKFEHDGKDLFINNKKVLKAWESFSGWYWFAVEKVQVQDSIIDEKVYEGDQIWFGLVQGLEEEWGDFSEGEINSLKPKTWEIPKSNWAWSGRRR